MSKLSRRNFLRTTLYSAAAAGAVSPMIVRAQDGVAANDKINCAVVGLNGRGQSHIGGFINNPNTVITYLVEVDEAIGKVRCDQVEKRQGSRPKLITDMRDAFADPELDVVGSATPNFWHGLSAIWAMQAGKDVYVEKPACHNVFEGRTMVA
ncbi:MAG: Gfo/Idh/MocA family oxidoreductase, partial [Thermoguttaceae bacterium]|nr:Gfo/Idh/MocA family oxidoreductase [Thermoguttaceae bacterium]